MEEKSTSNQFIALLSLTHTFYDHTKRTQAPTTKSFDGGKTQQTQILLGPHRVFPGRLSVSTYLLIYV